MAQKYAETYRYIPLRDVEEFPVANKIEDNPRSTLVSAKPHRRSLRTVILGGLLLAILGPCLFISNKLFNFPKPTSDENVVFPSPPKPEPIQVIELPLPPVAPNHDIGSCSIEINPRRTGCIAQKSNLQSGNFLPDGNHVTASVIFTGAPAAPDSASVYTGEQIIIVKVDGTTFPNGDHWRCITCGVLEKNKIGYNPSFDYVQAFNDGKRLLAGANIIESESLLIGDNTPETTRIIPIFWNTSSEKEKSGSMRELRLHPDQEHIAWSSFVMNPFGQFCYIGRLEYNPSTMRYEPKKIFLLVDPKGRQSMYIEKNELKINQNAIAIGEVRGFSGSGEEITYVGAPVESSNADVFAINLASGKIRRLTSHPEYVDPVDISPDDKWTVVMDTRGSNRLMFLSAMRGIPPLIDMITFAAVCSVRNNGQRRFFQPYLIDRYGDRGTYFGQKINDEGSGVSGSGDINDPEWNGAADPKWSPDGNRIVYTQKLTLSPACGGENPLPCYASTAEGGRVERMMMATLTSRKPYPPPPVTPFRDVVPWGVSFEPGSNIPSMHSLPYGNYILRGKKSGEAFVTIENTSVAVRYANFSNDGINFINGNEKASNEVQGLVGNLINWNSDINQTGKSTGTKKTSSEGFRLSINVFENMFEANGTLITTIDGVSYHQPGNRA